VQAPYLLPMMATPRDGRRRAADFPYFDNDGRPVAMAHRGGARAGPNIENTMAAFQNAVDLGYRYVETDVQATADGRVILFHDESPERLIGVPGAIARMDWADVARLRVNGSEPIPLLSEMLSSWPDLKVNIDAKARSTVAPLARAVEEHRAWDRVCVASFSPWRMRDLRSALGPRVAYGLTPWGVAGMRFLPGTTLKDRWLTGCGPVLQVPPRRFGIPLVTRRFVDSVHDTGRHIHVWTINDPQRMRSLLDLGVDGIISDRIDLLRDTLVSRGEWPGQP
jgi:glycerophosphoryl diester phosphodiesterase